MRAGGSAAISGLYGKTSSFLFFDFCPFFCWFSNYAFLPPLLIVCLYFSYRLVLTFIITILTIKTALMAAFILDFNRMSGVISFILNKQTSQRSDNSWWLWIFRLFRHIHPSNFCRRFYRDNSRKCWVGVSLEVGLRPESYCNLTHLHVHGHAGGICCQSNVNLAIFIKI